MRRVVLYPDRKDTLALSVDNTPQANIRIGNSSFSNTLAVWGDGSSELMSSGSAITHAYSPNYTGIVNLYFLDGFSVVADLRINDSNSIYNFDIAVLNVLEDLKLLHIISNNSICYGSTDGLSSNLEIVRIDSANSLWTGSLNNFSLNLYYLRLSSNVSLWTGSLGGLSAYLTSLYLSSNSSTWTGDLADLTNSLTSIYLISNSSTWTYSTKVWTSIPLIYVRPAPFSMTSTMVDQLLIDLNASGAAGSQTIDLRGNCGAPTAASATAITGLQALGHTVLTN